jgi:hypothetical protein
LEIVSEVVDDHEGIQEEFPLRVFLRDLNIASIGRAPKARDRKLIEVDERLDLYDYHFTACRKEQKYEYERRTGRA